MNRIAILKDYLRESPDDSFLLHALALEYVKTGDDATARNLFESILLKDAGYIGSYYHLAKLLERTGATEEAVKVYEAGMAASKAAGDQHAYGELRGAYEELVF